MGGVKLGFLSGTVSMGGIQYGTLYGFKSGPGSLMDINRYRARFGKPDG